MQIMSSASRGSPASNSWRAQFYLSRNTKIAIVFLLPSIVILAAIIIFPIGYSLTLTFQSYSLVIPGKTGQWIGFENYQKIISDEAFWAALGRVGLFTFLAVFIEVVIGVAFAYLLNTIHFGRRLLTSLLLIPTILTPVVIGLMFNLIFNAQFGLFNYLMQLMGIRISDGILNNPSTAFAALVAIDVWEWMPFIALIMLAGMQAIPEQPLEAAQIDGANAWQTFWMVMLPMLRPVLIVAVLFRAAEAIREFDKVYILTGGGPGTATELADLYLYRVSFSNWDLSYGATLGMIMFSLAMAAAILYFYITVKRGEIQR